MLMLPPYDAAGSMTEGPRAGDETTSSKRQWYVYDAWNRVMEIWEDTDNDDSRDLDATETLLVRNRYDGLGRRIARTSDNDASGYDRTDFYYNARWQVLEERAAAGEATEAAVVTAVYAQYIWDMRYIDSPVLRDRDADEGGDLGGGSGLGHHTN